MAFGGKAYYPDEYDTHHGYDSPAKKADRYDDYGPSGGYGAGGYKAPPRGGAFEKKEDWKDLLMDAPKLMNIGDIRDQLEGPKPLRALAAIGGLAMTGIAALALLNPAHALLHPFEFAVQIYMALFGLVVVVIETKSTGSQDNRLKQFIYKWAPFTSVVGGKGITYVFFGTLGISFGQENILLFGSGCYLALVGVVFILIGLGKFKTLEEKYDKSIYYSRVQ